jgi:hypothetical protein
MVQDDAVPKDHFHDTPTTNKYRYKRRKTVENNLNVNKILICQKYACFSL